MDHVFTNGLPTQVMMPATRHQYIRQFTNLLCIRALDDADDARKRVEAFLHDDRDEARRRQRAYVERADRTLRGNTFPRIDRLRGCWGGLERALYDDLSIGEEALRLRARKSLDIVRDDAADTTGLPDTAVRISRDMHRIITGDDGPDPLHPTVRHRLLHDLPGLFQACHASHCGPQRVLPENLPPAVIRTLQAFAGDPSSISPAEPVRAADGAPVFAMAPGYPYDPANPQFSAVNSRRRIGSNKATDLWLAHTPCVLPVFPGTGSSTPSQLVFQNDFQNEESPRRERTFLAALDAEGFVSILQNQDGSLPDPDGEPAALQQCNLIRPETMQVVPQPGAPVYVTVPRSFRRAGEHVLGPTAAVRARTQSVLLAAASSLGGDRAVRLHGSRQGQRAVFSTSTGSDGAEHPAMINTGLHAALVGITLAGGQADIYFGDPDVQGGKTAEPGDHGRRPHPIVPIGDLDANSPHDVNRVDTEYTRPGEADLGVLNGARRYLRAFHIARSDPPGMVHDGLCPGFGDREYISTELARSRHRPRVGYLGSDPATAETVALLLNPTGGKAVDIARQASHQGIQIVVPADCPAFSTTPWEQTTDFSNCDLVLVGYMDPRADGLLFSRLRDLATTPTYGLGALPPGVSPGQGLLYGPDESIEPVYGIPAPKERTIHADAARVLTATVGPARHDAGVLAFPDAGDMPPVLPHPRTHAGKHRIPRIVKAVLDRDDVTLERLKMVSSGLPTTERIPLTTPSSLRDNRLDLAPVHSEPTNERLANRPESGIGI